MDTEDISDKPEYIQLLLEQKKRLQDGQLLKGQKPQQMMHRDQLVMQFQRRLMINSQVSDRRGLLTTFLPPAYTPCATSLQEPQKIMIADLVLETHHRGTDMMLRTITPAYRLNAVMAIVEDDNNDVLELVLYHQPEESESRAQDILPMGQILFVKEPYLKLMSSGSHGLRSDHLSDVRPVDIFELSEPIPAGWQLTTKETIRSTSTDTWRLRGNDSFNNLNYFDAIKQ